MKEANWGFCLHLIVKVPVQQRLRWLSYVGGRGEYVTWVLRRPVASLTKHLCYRTGLLLCCRMSLVRQSGVLTFIMKCNYAIIDVSFYKLGKIRKHRDNLMCLWEREKDMHYLNLFWLYAGWHAGWRAGSILIREIISGPWQHIALEITDFLICS